MRPDWHQQELRCHLNEFLFRKNYQVYTLVSNLSGGEKARLSLCLIAVNPPSSLLLDEVTNNLNFMTKQHIIQILQQYPGVIIVLSHDEDFLQAINITHYYDINNMIIK